MIDSDSNHPDYGSEPSLTHSSSQSSSSSAGSGGGGGALPPSRPPVRGNPPRKGRISPLGWVLGVSGAFFLLFLVISGAIYFSKAPAGWESADHGGAILGGPMNAVGVIELKGVIMSSKKIISKLEDFADTPNIKAVVLRVDSPGGAVAPSQEIYQEVKNYKKPLVVSMGSVAASGAYYVSMGAKKVFANPGTITGSIGVIMEFADLQGLYQWAKVQRYSVKTGKFKDIGAEYRAMTPEEKALLQGMVDNVLTQFKQAVATGRHLSMDQVTQIADGRIFSGSQAKDAHLVDELGTLHDAVLAAAKMGGIHGKPEVIYPEKPKPRWLDLILDNATGGDRSSTSSGLISALTNILSGHVEKAVTGLEPGIYWIWGGAT